MVRQKFRLFLAHTAVAAGGLGILFISFILINLWDHNRLVFPQNLGNTRAADLLARQPALENTLKFAVVGDINNGTETFEEVISRLKDEQDVQFLVLLGDCAADPDMHLHRYFVHEFAETGFSLPTFVIAGNHDVGPKRFGYTEFEKLYGPVNFSFMYNGCLFIGLGGIHGTQKLPETLQFLETTLREKRDGARKVFVFMHYSPKASEYIPTDQMQYSANFQNLFEKYKVDYVFSGHYHRLTRTKVNGVVYFVTGGGGARLRRDRFDDIGLFHHITIIMTQGDTTAEHIIPIQTAPVFYKILERIERKGLTVIVPRVKRHPLAWGCGVLFMLAAFMWGLIVILMEHRIRKKALS